LFQAVAKASDEDLSVESTENPVNHRHARCIITNDSSAYFPKKQITQDYKQRVRKVRRHSDNIG
jgi:hypothetical protein